MKIGDAFEMVAAAFLAAAAYGYAGWRCSAIVVGVALLYEAQCLSHQPFPAVKLPRPRRPGWLSRAKP